MIKLARCGAKLALAGLVLSLAACGGGDGGGGGGSDPSTAPGLAVSPTSMSFSAVHNGAIPPTQTFQVTITRPDAAIVIAGFPVGVTPPTWLDQSSNLFNCTPSLSSCTLVARILTTNLVPGTYTTTLRFVIGNASQQLLALRDVQVSYTINANPIAASPSSLNFASIVGGPAPAAQQVTLTGDVGSWTSSANQLWIGVAPSSGTGVGTVNISVNPTGLAPGTYTGSVTFSSGGNTAPVNVTLTVTAAAIQTNSASLSYSGVNGATIASQPLTITMNNGATLSWTASTPLPDTWLVLDRTSGTQADALGVSVNPANGPLASGVHNSSITLQGTSGGSPFNKTVNVTLTLTKATLTPSPVSVTLGGANGRDFSGVPVQISLNTGANSFSWTSSSSSFVQRSLSSGSVSATPVSVTLTPNAAGLSGGTHIGSATFSATVNGDTVTANVPVTFNLESHKLLVDGNGVGFAKTLTLSTLTRTLKVRDNLGLATAWTASKTQSWLTITTSGTAGDNLVLTADPTGLTTDTVYFDTVTIDSPDTSVENRGTEKVRVGFWVGSADPTSNSITVDAIVIAADPIRPYAYAAVGPDIRVYNIYTGALLNTITGVAAGGGFGSIQAMTASHDGSTLYVLDVTNSKIVRVDLDAQAVGTSFSVSTINTLRIIDYTRTNGVEILASGSGGQVFNAQTGALFPSTFAGNTVVSVSRGGTRLCTVGLGQFYSISCSTFDFTSLNGGQLLLGNTSEVSGGGGGGSGQDAAVRPDGAVFYVAAGGSAELSAYLTSGQNPTYVGAGQSPAPIGAHPDNVEIAPDGRIFGTSEFGTSADVWIFNANGTPYSTPTLQFLAFGDHVVDRQLRISGDGLRLITLSVGPVPSGLKVNFTTIP